MGEGYLMLQGVCTNPGQTAVLERGKRYFLFHAGSNHFYVSNFPNPNAHKGCFQAKYFQLVEKEEWPQEPEIKSINLDPEKLYKAKLIWRKPGYKSTELKEYYLRPKITHGTFYHESHLKECGGCFPLYWFSDFEEVSLDILEIIDQEIPDFDIEFDKSDQFLAESERIPANYEQLSLFY